MGPQAHFKVAIWATLGIILVGGFVVLGSFEALFRDEVSLAVERIFNGVCLVLIGGIASYVTHRYNA